MAPARRTRKRAVERSVSSNECDIVEDSPIRPGRRNRLKRLKRDDIEDSSNHHQTVLKESSVKENNACIENDIVKEQPWDLDFFNSEFDDFDWTFDQHHQRSVSLEKSSIHPRPASPSILDGIYLSMPKSSNDLALNPKKVSELSVELSKALQTSSNSPLIILRGPSGSGKTTALLSVCHELSISVTDGYEFLESHHQSYSGRSAHQQHWNLSKYSALSMVCEEDDNGSLSNFSPADRRSESIISKPTKRVVLFDNLPNDSIYLALQGSRRGMDNSPWSMLFQDPSVVIILVITDPCIAESWMEQRFYDSLCKDPNARVITFNAVASSFLKKLSLHSSSLSKGGNLHQCFIQAFMDSLSLSVETDKWRQSADDSFGLFHALGKILYPRNQKDPVDVTLLTDSDRPLFHAFLFTNYPSFISRLLPPLAFGALSTITVDSTNTPSGREIIANRTTTDSDPKTFDSNPSTKLSSLGSHIDPISAIADIAESFSQLDALDWSVRRLDEHFPAASFPEQIIAHTINQLDLQRQSLNFKTKHHSSANGLLSITQPHPQYYRHHGKS